ncbi:MAG: undecaprenyldiphospho-muramoylpentapeptide beta-N-acetylglucosaminyltransferase [Anaerolineales bacterium]|nr:MAG: undecaprenyldiphospho-muramoylpentapeptide beta-N-acetylglucosaminyltransferase [Anaerolineales bacterium]
MRLMISGGGTGGHVYPALTVADWLAIDNLPPPAICWVGSTGGAEEKLVARAGIPFEGISAKGLRGKNPLAILDGLWTLRRGIQQARRLVASFQPDVLFVTGGYVCTPVTLAARLAGVPALIYLPDMQPGLAIKFLARFADRVAVTARPAMRHFRPGQAVVTGYPVRRKLFERDRAEARARWGLGPEDKQSVLLVFGGSQGARSINQAVSRGIEALLSIAQVIHISGQRDADWTQAGRASLPESLKARFHLHAYLHEEMVDALLAADLVVSRAGASTLGEFPAAGLPAVLVPYPYAGAHQWDNAQYLVQANAAVTIDDADLGTDLLPTVLDLLRDSDRRAEMQRAARALARPDAAQRIVHELKELAQ